MKFKTSALFPAIALIFSSCHNPVFDYEGDCEVSYGLRFVYDMNLDWADAFPTLVNKVNLYAFDSNGIFVKEYLLNEAQTSIPGYTMTLDLEPGDYTLVAWSALETGIPLSEGFSIPSMTPGVSRIEDLTCSVITKSSAQYPCYSDLRLPFLYHGSLEVNLPDSRDGQDYIYTMYLTKDTNHVRASIHKVGDNISEDEIEMRIPAIDGVMAWNNTLTGDEIVTYLPWDINTDELTDSDDEEGQEGAVYYGVVADIMTGRLTDRLKNSVYLYVVNKTTEATLFKVPLIQYELMGKSYYEEAYGKTMTDAEFLDRQSEYNLTFFVDENMNLLYTEIRILSWRLVIHNYDI